jgi:hypothetical protein
VIIIHDPRAAALASSLQPPAELAHPACALDQIAGQRVAGDMVNQQAALVIVHDPPRRSQELGRRDDADGD